MKFEEILSFLENDEKRQRFINKLKLEGPNSKPRYVLENLITSLKLNKTPEAVNQKTILQHTFKFCSPEECFDIFRMVSKTWKNSVETIRFNRVIDITKLPSLMNNGRFAPNVSTYFKTFKKLKIFMTEETFTNWNPIGTFLLENMKNLNVITLLLTEYVPENFDLFITQLFENSKISLKILLFGATHILPFPEISLVNVEIVKFVVESNHNHQVENFDKFIKLVLKHCTYLNEFYIYDILEAPQILQYITQNHSEHCIEVMNNKLAKRLPAKISVCKKLKHLSSSYTYPHLVKCLLIYVKNFDLPYQNGWENYQNIFLNYSNVRDILIFSKENGQKIYLLSNLENLSPEIRNIWEERIEYLQSQGLSIITMEQFHEKQKEAHENIKWTFKFW